VFHKLKNKMKTMLQLWRYSTTSHWY